ncbi:hypothetical protein DIPPA_06299 [Diplonema papillatum]|nr:hypothetical protein DIPPA_06299 [Diplonema papillatum]
MQRCALAQRRCASKGVRAYRWNQRLNWLKERYPAETPADLCRAGHQPRAAQPSENALDVFLRGREDRCRLHGDAAPTSKPGRHGRPGQDHRTEAQGAPVSGAREQAVQGRRRGEAHSPATIMGGRPESGADHRRAAEGMRTAPRAAPQGDAYVGEGGHGLSGPIGTAALERGASRFGGTAGEPAAAVGSAVASAQPAYRPDSRSFSRAAADESATASAQRVHRSDSRYSGGAAKESATESATAEASRPDPSSPIEAAENEHRASRRSGEAANARAASRPDASQAAETAGLGEDTREWVQQKALVKALITRLKHAEQKNDVGFVVRRLAQLKVKPSYRVLLPAAHLLATLPGDGRFDDVAAFLAKHLLNDPDTLSRANAAPVAHLLKCIHRAGQVTTVRDVNRAFSLQSIDVTASLSIAAAHFLHPRIQPHINFELIRLSLECFAFYKVQSAPHVAACVRAFLRHLAANQSPDPMAPRSRGSEQRAAAGGGPLQDGLLWYYSFVLRALHRLRVYDDALFARGFAMCTSPRLVSQLRLAQVERLCAAFDGYLQHAKTPENERHRSPDDDAGWRPLARRDGAGGESEREGSNGLVSPAVVEDVFRRLGDVVVREWVHDASLRSLTKLLRVYANAGVVHGGLFKAVSEALAAGNGPLLQYLRGHGGDKPGRAPEVEEEGDGEDGYWDGLADTLAGGSARGGGEAAADRLRAPSSGDAGGMPEDIVCELLQAVVWAYVKNPSNGSVTVAVGTVCFWLMQRLSSGLGISQGSAGMVADCYLAVASHGVTVPGSLTGLAKGVMYNGYADVARLIRTNLSSLASLLGLHSRLGVRAPAYQTALCDVVLWRVKTAASFSARADHTLRRAQHAVAAVGLEHHALHGLLLEALAGSHGGAAEGGDSAPLEPPATKKGKTKHRSPKVRFTSVREAAEEIRRVPADGAARSCPPAVLLRPRDPPV